MKSIWGIIGRNKITLLGYIAIIAFDILTLVLTNIVLNNEALADSIFGPIGLVNSGVVNEVGVYSLVGGILFSLTGVNVLATTKEGWESKSKYEERVHIKKEQQAGQRFIHILEGRISDYKANYTPSISYSSMYPEGIVVKKAAAKMLESIRGDILSNYKENKSLTALAIRELDRIIIKEEVETYKEEAEVEVKW